MRAERASDPGIAKLGAEVSASLEQTRIAQHGAARVRAKLVARQPSRFRLAPRLRTPRIAGAVAFAATIALGVFFAWPRPPSSPKGGALSFVVGEGKKVEQGEAGAFIAAPTASETPVTFSDGSKVRLAPAARVRVAEVAQNGARVRVESGEVFVSVVHKDETRWAVEAGPFEVRVTGTKFAVDWDPAATGLVVRLEEGSVYVRGCGLDGEGRRLVAGEQLRASCNDHALSVTPARHGGAANAEPAVAPRASRNAEPAVTPNALPDAPAEQAPAGPRASAKSPAPVETAPSAGGAPRASTAGAQDVAPQKAADLARRGAHAEAVMAAEANGFAATCDALSAPELLLLADAGRYAGRFDRAAEALTVTRRRFPASDAAATAAFELGRIDMDIRRDLDAAGDYFETYLRERPSGSLAREALGRALEARHRAGNTARAERLAVRYLATYPDGPYANLAHKLAVPAPGGRP
jgi:ferric-dicitrate binding protein FerR (iron transport regulator)